MKKIVITIFILPNEIDDLERVLIDLCRASKYINGEMYEFYLGIGIDDYLVDWENSKLDKQYFIDRFYALKQLTSWASKTTFKIDENILGVISLRRVAHLECKNATHFIWLDTDIVFDEKTLYFMQEGINVSDNSNFKKYIISPECVQLWDDTWYALVNENFINKKEGYCKTNNPFIDSGIYGEVRIENLYDNKLKGNVFKLGSGWFNCLSKPLLDRLPLPESLGHYGPDDDYIMFAGAKICNKEGDIYQFKLKNVVVCENYAYRDRTYYNKLIKPINRKDEFKNKCIEVMTYELDKI